MVRQGELSPDGRQAGSGGDERVACGHGAKARQSVGRTGIEHVSSRVGALTAPALRGGNWGGQGAQGGNVRISAASSRAQTHTSAGRSGCAGAALRR